MARKPTPKPAKRRAKAPNTVRRGKSAHAQAHAKRIASKHQSKKSARGLSWLPQPLRTILGKTVRVPRLHLEVSFGLAAAFVAVLGIASGAGYWGAKSLFGASSHRAGGQSPQLVIQQTHSLHGVILPDPNGVEPHQNRAYEEKALEEVYEPEPPARHSVPSPEREETVARAAPSDAVVPRDQPLWMRNALATPLPTSAAPRIAIVIDDMGVDRKRSKRMWEDVPGPLTLSFMTYADDLPAQTQAARAKGHELMLHMSMEPSNATIDAGPNVLLSAMPEQEIRSLANWGMDRFEGFVGVNNHMGSRFTEYEPGMRAVLEEIQKRGLIYLDSRTSNSTVGPRLARELGVPMLERNVFLDNENVPQKVLKQLAEAERLARKHGFAIAIGHPRDATIKVLKTWMNDARARGVELVPVSTLMREKLIRLAGRSQG